MNEVFIVWMMFSFICGFLLGHFLTYRKIKSILKKHNVDFEIYYL